MTEWTAVVVGAGGISRKWFEALRKAGVGVPAVVDLRLQAARARIEEFKLDAEASTDLRRTLKKHRPDFIIDATSPKAHCAVVCTALKLGCHALGEKPMAADMTEARRMARTAEKTRRMYMVDQSHRWLPDNDRVKQAVARGVLGRLTTLNCDFYMPSRGRAAHNFRLTCRSPLLFDMSIHHFDLARMYGGAEPVAVLAHEFNPHGSWYRGDAAASCIFEMTGGVVFTYRASWVADGLRTSWWGDWRLIGERGTILHDGVGEPRGEVLARPAPPGTKAAHRPARLPAPSFTDRFMDAALREMLLFLRTGRVPQTECHDNIRSLAMVFAAMESSRRRRWVKVRW